MNTFKKFAEAQINTTQQIHILGGTCCIFPTEPPKDDDLEGDNCCTTEEPPLG